MGNHVLRWGLNPREIAAANRYFERGFPVQCWVENTSFDLKGASLAQASFIVWRAPGVSWPEPPLFLFFSSVMSLRLTRARPELCFTIYQACSCRRPQVSELFFERPACYLLSSLLLHRCIPKQHVELNQVCSQNHVY